MGHNPVVLVATIFVERERRESAKYRNTFVMFGPLFPTIRKKSKGI